MHTGQVTDKERSTNGYCHTSYECKVDKTNMYRIKMDKTFIKRSQIAHAVLVGGTPF